MAQLCANVTMFLFSTVIYFSDGPMGYDLYKENDNFQFRPAIDHHGNFLPPVITAVQLQGNWFIEGTDDEDIIEQARKVVELNELIAVLNVAS